MRFVVLLLGIVGVVCTSATGYFYFENSLAVDVNAFAPDEIREYVVPLTGSPLGWANGDTGVFVLLCGAYGLLGVLFAFARCGWQGALLMILPPLLTAALNPYSLAFTGLQVFVGLLAFFVFPLPLEASKDDRPAKAKPRTDRDMEDEWSGRGGPADDADAPTVKMKPPAKGKRSADDDE